MRRILLLLCLLLPLPAHAITLTCGQNFAQHCDPFTGLCYTKEDNQIWNVTLNGVAQPQCSNDPTECWLAKYQACPAPITAPVAPNAIRSCPMGAACIGSNLESIPGYPIPASVIPPTGLFPHADAIFWCSKEYTVAGGPVDILPSALKCATLLHYTNICYAQWYQQGTVYYEAGPPELCDDLNYQGFYYGELYYGQPGYQVYEPDGTGCNAWKIELSPLVETCVMGSSMMLATYKDNATQWTGLRRYYDRVAHRQDVKSWALSNGLYGQPNSRRYEIHAKRLTWLITLTDLLLNLIADPPNPNYAFFPPLPPAVPLNLPTAGIDLSQGELDATTIWLTKVSDLTRTLSQLNSTIDNLAGALLAAEAGTPGAALWVHDLALASETISATAKTQGLAEIAARNYVVAQTPSTQEPAACSTPTVAATMFASGVRNGVSLYQAHLGYQAHLSACGAAQTWPNWLTQSSLLDTEDWTSFAPSNLASYLCAANVTYCGTPVPVIQATPNPGLLATVPVGSATSINVEVKNIGTAPLVLGVFGLQGGQPQHFQLPAAKNYCNNQTLQPGQSCLVRVRFAPTAPGAWYTKVRIPSNDPTTPILLDRMTGIGQ